MRETLKGAGIKARPVQGWRRSSLARRSGTWKTKKGKREGTRPQGIENKMRVKTNERETEVKGTDVPSIDGAKSLGLATAHDAR